MKLPFKKSNKVFKLKTTAFQKVGRVILWTFFIFLLLRGIGTLFSTDETAKAQDIVSGFKSTIDLKAKIEFEASAYAESFAYEFMTYDPAKLSEYRLRISNYISTYLGEIGPNTDTNVKTEVLSAKAYEVEWISEKQLNVNVWLKVKYLVQEKIENEVKLTEKHKVTGIKIPIAVVEGKYVVEGYPAFIAVQDKAEVDYEIYNSNTAERWEADEIREVLNSFFKVYYSGSLKEISYYMENSKNVKGLENSFVFNRLGTVNVYVDDTKQTKDKTYTALAELYITDPDSKLDMKQKYHVKLVKNEDRYYITKFDVRTDNLGFLNNNIEIENLKEE